MNKDINIQPNETKFDITKYDNGSIGVFCTKSVILHIYDKQIEFVAGNLALCAKDDIFDESFGKALSWIRASKDIGNQVENYLIKYSCSHSQFNNNIECNLTLNTKSFDKNLDRLSNNVDKLIDKLNTANNKVNCKIFGEDGFISNLSIDLADEPQTTTLDKLVGKWAIRTKSVIKDNGYVDTSWMKYPLFVLELTSEGIKI